MLLVWSNVVIFCKHVPPTSAIIQSERLNVLYIQDFGETAMAGCNFQRRRTRGCYSCHRILCMLLALITTTCAFFYYMARVHLLGVQQTFILSESGIKHGGNSGAKSGSSGTDSRKQYTDVQSEFRKWSVKGHLADPPLPNMKNSNKMPGDVNGPRKNELKEDQIDQMFKPPSPSDEISIGLKNQMFRQTVNDKSTKKTLDLLGQKSVEQNSGGTVRKLSAPKEQKSPFFSKKRVNDHNQIVLLGSNVSLELDNTTAINKRTFYKDSTSYHANKTKDYRSYMNIFQRTGSAKNAECVPLHIYLDNVNDTTICIHNTTEDEIVSGVLKAAGTWEQDALTSIGRILYAHPEMVFIDVGSHVGTYSVHANAIGNRVIAIDPLKINLELLSRSLYMLNKQNNSVLLWNAVAENHRNVTIGSGQKRNLGSTFIIPEDPSRMYISKIHCSVLTITIDDLVDAFKLENKTVAMKMDIEGMEYKALLGAGEFFRRVKVCFVAMEIIVHKADGTGEKIVEFMKRFDLYPYRDPYMRKRLFNVKHFGADVYFARNSTECLPLTQF